jgi:hypothetical protein
MSLLGRMEWVYGSILGGVGRSSLTLLNLRWEMASRSVFGMICDVGTWLLRMPFHIYLALCANDASIVTHLEFSGAST